MSENENLRREVVSFDAFYFENKQADGRFYSRKDAFQHIYDSNLWGSVESNSGEGSTQLETQHLWHALQCLVKEYNITTLLDAPCGDFQWLSQVDLPIKSYYGVDIVPQCIETLCLKYPQENRQFICADICTDVLPSVDLIFCRDCLVHLSYEDIMQAFQNFKKSGSQYLLMTTFDDCTQNDDIVTGDWRPLNFEKAPFNFPKPLTRINEGCQQNNGLYQDKSLGLWCLDAG